MTDRFPHSRKSGLLALLAVSLAVLLAACVPRTEAPRATVEQLSQNIGFYPAETGARWDYLPQDAPLDEDRIFQAIEGPRIVAGRPLISVLLVGGGLERRDFRSYEPSGVRLHLRTVPGAQMTFDPPLMEFPASSELRRGASWSGASTVVVSYPDKNISETYDVTYESTVVDRRIVRVAAGQFDVYVINTVSSEYSDDGEFVRQLTQERWFSPYVGEVRTVSGYYLTGMNFEPVYP